MALPGLDDRPERGAASEFEDELAEIGEEDSQALAETNELEQQYALEMEEAQNKERTQNRIKNLAENAVKKEAVALGKKAVKTAATSAARSIAVAVAPYVGGVLLVLGAIVLVFVILIVILDYNCNQTGVSGTTTRAMSFIGAKLGYIPADACTVLTQAKTAIGFKTGNPPDKTPDQTGPDSDLVSIADLPSAGVSNPQVRECMEPGVREIFARAQAAGISLVLTSAYRPESTTAGGGLSAHSRGEAVDIAIRPVGQLSDPAFKAKIRALVNIAINVGYTPAVGDTLDEYANPAENATGGHVHVEYNPGYCDQVNL